jgi:hypothetical protein
MQQGRATTGLFMPDTVCHREPPIVSVVFSIRAIKESEELHHILTIDITILPCHAEAGFV